MKSFPERVEDDRSTTPTRHEYRRSSPTRLLAWQRHRESSAVVLATLAMLSLPPATAAAQDTRAEAIRQEQESRQHVLSPPQPTRVERFVARLAQWGTISGTPRGLYPWFGSVYPGGGFAAGPAVRMPIGDDGAISVIGGYSINGFVRAQSDVALPTMARNRAQITLSAQYIDAPDVNYYGIGNSSSASDRTQFAYRPTSTGAALDVDLGRHVSVGGGVSYVDIDTAAAPSIEPGTDVATPGGERDEFSYINSRAVAAFDARRPLGYSGQGGFYRVQFDDYRDRLSGAYSFRSLEAEVQQLFPVLRANWVIALRGLATVTDADEASAVPYFMLPALGGGATLRGFSNFRFRDRNRLLMSGELRWTPARFLDMAVFCDMGKVAARRQDLDFTDLKESYGIGARIVGIYGYALRLEVAHSRENAARILVSTGGSF